MKKPFSPTFLLALLMSFFPITGADLSIVEKGRTIDVVTTLPNLNLVTLVPASDYKLPRVASVLKEMPDKKRADLAKRLGSSKRTELESIIPSKHKAAVTTQSSCCLAFWKRCATVSAKALGKLAIDLVMDIADGKLDGKGPLGPINYGEHLADIVDEGIAEFQAATRKKIE